MAKGDVMIKDAPLLEQISGREKIPVSYGGSEPMTVSIDQIKDFVDLSEYAKKDDFKTINGESILGEGNIKIQGGSGDSPIDYGEAEHSAVLKGETTALGETYKNEALNEGCVSLGANSKAGLKGYYFTYIDFETNQIWLHNKQFTSRTLGSLGGWKKNSVSDSNRCGWSVDDVISFTCDGHYDNSATITDVTDNVITVDKIPFTLDDVPSTIVNIGVANNKFDECSVFCVKKYNIGTVELGGGAFAIGTNTKAVNAVAYAEGYNTTAYGKYSHAEGNETEAGYNAHSEGYLTKAIGARSHSEGRENIAEGNCSHAEGRDNKAIGENAHAEGWYTQALGKQSHSEGYSTIAQENQSHAEGKETQALGNASHAEGLQTIASGPSSHAEGEANVAGGDCSHVEGYLNETTKTGAHVEGKNNKAEAHYTHVEGIGNVSDGYFSHTEGVGHGFFIGIRSGKSESTLYEVPSIEDRDRISVGDKVYRKGYKEVTVKEIYSGDSKWIKLSDKIGHIRPYDEDDDLTYEKVLFISVEGQMNRASGVGSHAEGVGTQTSNYGESAVGRFNESKEGLIFSVGNGTSDEDRRNAFEVYENGHVYFKTLENIADAINEKLPREEFEERIEGYATADSVQELSDNVTELSLEVSGLSEDITLRNVGASDTDEGVDEPIIPTPTPSASKEWKCVYDGRLEVGQMQIESTTYADGTPLDAEELVVQVIMESSEGVTQPRQGYVEINSSLNKNKEQYGAIYFEKPSLTNPAISMIRLKASPFIMVADVLDAAPIAVAQGGNLLARAGRYGQIYENISYVRVYSTQAIQAIPPIIKIYAR